MRLSILEFIICVQTESLGRDLIPRPFPYQEAQIQAESSDFWHKYKEFLIKTQRKSSVSARYNYAKRYYCILVTGNAQDLLTLSKDKQVQIMKSLSNLSKFIGCYDKWKEIKERYQLTWTDDNSLDIFHSLLDGANNYSVMLEWLKSTIQTIQPEYGNILVYSTLTGLRPDETCQSINLIKTDLENYLNREKMILEHFRYHNIFIRKTKQAYVTLVDNSILELAKNAGIYSYNALRCYLKQREIPMHMNYCRKIFATFLRQNGIEQEMIDLLQGRIPKSIFVRHYYRPDLNGFDRVRNIIQELFVKII